MLCNCHICLVPKHFCYPLRRPIPIKQLVSFPLPSHPASGNHESVSAFTCWIFYIHRIGICVWIPNTLGMKLVKVLITRRHISIPSVIRCGYYVSRIWFCTSYSTLSALSLLLVIIIGKVTNCPDCKCFFSAFHSPTNFSRRHFSS